MKSTLIYYDNVSAIYLSTNPMKINPHFVREHMTIGDVRVLHVPTTSNS
jgi:hypothetical protein